MKKIQELILKYPNTALILLISIVYLYFQTDMMLRTTGDEKTYVAQALEMQERGYWFVQTWAEEHDYYKGPLHFILLRIGFFLFGDSIFATLYMNFFGLIAATLLLYRFFLKESNDNSWAIFYAGSFATGVGLYAHMFASQMEAQLVILYAMILYFLNKVDADKSLINQIILWSLIGLIGWSKSPAYSVFLGLSVLLYWIFTSQIQNRVKERITWIAFAIGIAVGIGGYLPIVLQDGDIFIQNYIIKESLNKGANGVPWESAFFPVFTYYLAPWMFASVFSFFVAIYTIFSKKERVLSTNEIRLIKLSLAIIIPTLTFFTLHPYRGEIYALPAVSATWLIALIYWRAYTKRFEITYVWMMRLSVFVLSIIPAAIIAMVVHLSPMPDFWPSSLLYIAIAGGIFSFYFVFIYSKKVAKEGPAPLIIAFLPLFIMMGLIFQSFGKAEMSGLKNYIKENHVTQPIGYYNVHRNVWNEYGYLNFWVNHKVVGVHTQAKLKEWLSSGGIVILSSRIPLEAFRLEIATLLPHAKLDVRPWHRWLTHGKDENGESRFNKYWRTKDISTIEQNFYIIKVKD